MSGSQRRTGMFTPNIVPLDRRGEIDEAGLRNYVDWLIGHGVDRPLRPLTHSSDD